MSRGGVQRTPSVGGWIVGVAGAVLGAVLGVPTGAYLGVQANGRPSLHGGVDFSGLFAPLAGGALGWAVGALAGGWARGVAEEIGRGPSAAGGRRPRHRGGEVSGSTPPRG